MDNKHEEVVPVERLWCSIEAILELAVKLLGLVVVYLVFEFIGKLITGGEFKPDTLLSLVVLPAIYILKELHVVLEPFFVNIILSDDQVTVESGILTRRLDCLNLKNVENVEMITTPFGRLFDYSTLVVYAYGSWVKIPHIKSPLPVKKRIEESIVKQSDEK